MVDGQRLDEIRSPVMDPHFISGKGFQNSRSEQLRAVKWQYYQVTVMTGVRALKLGLSSSRNMNAATSSRGMVAVTG